MVMWLGLYTRAEINDIQNNNLRSLSVKPEVFVSQHRNIKDGN